MDGVLSETFSVDDDQFGETRTIDLTPNGRNIDLTDENKKQYVELVFSAAVPYLWKPLTCSSSLVTEWKIQKRVQEQFNAFITGFNELIPADLVNVFDERELELLIGGIADIDVDDWKKHTDYRGYQEQDEVIQNFWKVGCYDVQLERAPMADALRRSSAPGMPSRSLDSCNLLQAHPGSRSMGSRTSRAAMDLADSPSRSLVIRPRCRSRILGAFSSLSLL